MAINYTPLAERMRPQYLSDIIGQDHLIGKGAPLRNLIEHQNLPSLLLWGPPGVGKTTLAKVIAKSLQRPFFQISAINSGVKEIRDIIEKAEHVAGCILFIDEIHRFNKSQQDALLMAVEKGTITLIGATTENPSFEVNRALISRCQLMILRSLAAEDLIKIIQFALKNDLELNKFKVSLHETDALIQISGGDVRKILNALEIIIQQFKIDDSIIITNQLVNEVIKKNILLYDKKGDYHYDIISAFIKSMRGSNPNAAVYWLARMLHAGEELSFIARRMIIFASEDIGNANPNALLLANACFESVEKIGYPESRIILSHCAIYLASSPKSNASYLAIEEAMALVEKTGNLPVPLHLRNAPTLLMKQLNYGKNYQYPHNFENNFIEQDYLPETINELLLYKPQQNAKEQEIKKFLGSKWKVYNT